MRSKQLRHKPQFSAFVYGQHQQRKTILTFDTQLGITSSLRHDERKLGQTLSNKNACSLIKRPFPSFYANVI